jgi:DNA-binding PadR family transcriptional regulator
MKEEGLIEVVDIVESGVRGGKRVVYGLTDEGWRELARIILAKAKGKMRFVNWMIVEGASLLRSKGYIMESEEICGLISDSCELLADSIRENCQK